MDDFKYKEIMKYLLDKIPLILDMEKQDLKFDTRDINYKIYKYIHDLKEKKWLKYMQCTKEKNV